MPNKLDERFDVRFTKLERQKLREMAERLDLSQGGVLRVAMVRLWAEVKKGRVSRDSLSPLVR